MMSEALRKAAEQALAALENLDGIDTETECVTICVGDEINALRAALKKPVLQAPTELTDKDICDIADSVGEDECKGWWYSDSADMVTFARLVITAANGGK
jgi:hypothetical protein